MASTLLPSTRAIADLDSLNTLRPKPVFLHPTPGIFFGSNTIRTSLDRATALDARQSVSGICLRGGCSFCRQRIIMSEGAWAEPCRASLPSLGTEACTLLKADVRFRCDLLHLDVAVASLPHPRPHPLIQCAESIDHHIQISRFPTQHHKTTPLSSPPEKPSNVATTCAQICADCPVPAPYQLQV